VGEEETVGGAKERVAMDEYYKSIYNMIICMLCIYNVYLHLKVPK
jgi:hypothetical protein